MSYCDGDKPTPPTPPTPAECISHLRERCDKKNATETCEVCAEKLGKEHGCTVADEKAACASTPPKPKPDPKPTRGGFTCDAATKTCKEVKGVKSTKAECEAKCK
jgi:hypothetical protein